jgi:hypothetical protein
MLFAGSTPVKEMNYRTHNTLVSKLFELADIHINAVTHAFRSAGAQNLEAQG